MDTTEVREIRLMRTTLFAFFVSGTASVLLGNLMPFLREEYDINYATAGLLLSLPSWGNLFSLFITGYLPSYIGRRKTVLATSVWMSVAFAIFAFGIGGSMLLPLACLMVGIARGGNNNFCNIMMSTLSGKRSAVGFNLLHGAFAIGAVVSPPVLILCAGAHPQGWRIMAAIIAVLSLIQLTVYCKMALPAETISGSIKTVDRSFLKSRSFWLATAIIFFYVSMEYATVTWLVTYFRDTGILSPDISQLMSSLLWVVIFIGRMLGALLVGRVSRKIILVTDGMGALVFFLLIFFSRSQTPIFLGVMGMGFFMATIYTTAMAFGTRQMKGNDLGVSTMTFLGSTGGIITPALVGLVAEKAGIQMGMGVVVGVTAMLFIVILVSVLSDRSSEQ